jgi:release factor glutamine methyltransferase
VEPWTVRRILEWTARDLATRGVDTPRLDAELLLAHALGTDRLGLFLDLDRPLGEAERAQFRELVARRRRREPVAYVIGTKEFWSLSFAVGPATLVPRPDTEAVVEEALEAIPGDGRGLRAVDVGCGSGCIGLSLAHERSGLRVVSVDVDRRTAAVAAANAAALGLADRVDVVVGDLVSCLAGHVDLLVANLPYVPSGEIESLEPEVSRWEPRRALDGGADGLDLFRRLLADCPRLLAPGAAILLEVGHDGQARQVVGLLGDGWSDVEVRRDYSGVQRVVSARRQPAAFTAPRQ